MVPIDYFLPICTLCYFYCVLYILVAYCVLCSHISNGLFVYEPSFNNNSILVAPNMVESLGIEPKQRERPAVLPLHQHSIFSLNQNWLLHSLYKFLRGSTNNLSSIIICPILNAKHIISLFFNFCTFFKIFLSFFKNFLVFLN